MRHSLFDTNHDALLEGIRLISTGAVDHPTVTPTISLLEEIGLAANDSLTQAGVELFRLAWVKRDRPGSLELLGRSLRRCLVLQVLEQELRGLDAVPEAGALDLLRHHRAAPIDLSQDKARRTFIWLNECGAIKYSKRYKTVRPVWLEPDHPQPGEDRSLAAMISPTTPFSNLVRLRRILRSLSGTIYWADPHFGARALEDLATEVDTAKVSDIRVLSGDATNVLTPKSWRDFQRFQEEMRNKSVLTEWRVDPARDWHDRWLIDLSGGFNMPPVNNLYQGQYAEMLPTGTLPPVDDWWGRSFARSS